MTLHGLPTATESLGMSLTTTLPPPLAAHGVDRVAGRVKPAVRRHEHVLAERHRGAVENDEIVVGVKVLPSRML